MTRGPSGAILVGPRAESKEMADRLAMAHVARVDAAMSTRFGRSRRRTASWSGGRNGRNGEVRANELVCAGKKRTFGEQILDYVEGGPKLRKWYGATDEPRRRKDTNEEERKEESREGSVLVVGGDTPTGELVVLQLVLASARVTALVKDAEAEKNAYGLYVVPVEGTSNDPEAVKEGLKGAKSIVVVGQLGCVAELAASGGEVEHIVLLSSVDVARGGSTGFAKLLGGEQATIDSVKREQKVVASGIPYTIVRVVNLKDAPLGRPSGIRTGKEGTLSGTVTRADAAAVLVNALEYPPKTGRIFEVAAGDMGLDGDWERIFESIQDVGA